jgi:hypothetical protein
MKYSKLQYFFWLISGCEISVLKNCPTDYNRQAGIGLTIFMTTLMAFASGTYAGWFFAKNIFGAICFGLLWAALIFSIDRSMVITMKKDPTKIKQSLWIPFSSRAVMAILIAFIISIPLELLIFSDNIDIHLSKFQNLQTQNLKTLVTQNVDVQGSEKDYDKTNERQKKSENDVKRGAPTHDATFDNLKSAYEQRHQLLGNLERDVISAKQEANLAYNRIPENPETGQKEENSSEYRSYLKKNNKLKAANFALRAFDQNGLAEAKKRFDQYYNNWLKTNQEIAANAMKRLDSVRLALDIQKQKVNKAGDELEAKQKEKNDGFVFRYMVLDDLASASNPKENPEGRTILFLLWLIRGLFFTIEILPMVAKIYTPVGAYDWAIYRNEEDFRMELQQKTQDYLDHQKQIREQQHQSGLDQAKQQAKIEKKLHEKILLEVASVQGEIAHQKIEEFRKMHIPTIQPTTPQIITPITASTSIAQPTSVPLVSVPTPIIPVIDGDLTEPEIQQNEALATVPVK